MLTPQQLFDFLAQYRRGLSRYWQWSLAAFLGVLLFTGAGLVLLPRTYLSEARLYVKYGREIQMDPTAAGGQVVAPNESRESELNSLLEVLRSRALLDKLVATVTPGLILRGVADPPAEEMSPSDTDSTADSLADPEPLQPTVEHRQAIAALEKMLDIWIPRKSNVIGVSCKGKTPEQAQQIVSRLVEIFLDEHVRVHHTPGSYKFFAEQTALTRQRWEAASEKLRVEKNRLGVVTIEGKRNQLQSEITDSESRLLSNQAELNTTEAKIASLRQLIATLPEKIVTQQAQAQNMAFDTMRASLFQLETREQELASKMGDAHPQLIAVRQQVADLREILAEQKPQRIQATEAVNPQRQALELALLTELSQAEALRGRGESLASLRRNLQNDLELLTANETSLALLQREVDQAESRHAEYAQKLEQARINRSLDEERISSIRLVQPASFATKPSGPRRLYVVACGVMLATFLALSVPLAGNWLNPAIMSGEELARLLDVPLVGLMPALANANTAA